MKRHISIFAFLLCALVATARAAGAETQTVNGGYYFVEGGPAGTRDLNRMSVDGKGMAWTKQNLEKGAQVTFVATPGAGMKIWQWGSKSTTGPMSTMKYSSYDPNWTTVTWDTSSYVWTAEPDAGTGYLAVNFKYITYNVNYDANDGTGAPDSVNGKRYDTHFNLSSTTPTKAGFDFSGWKPNTKTDKIYSPGQEVSGVDLCSDDWHKDGETVTLVAQWSRSAPSFTLEQVAQAEWKAETTVTVVSTTLKSGDATLDKAEYEKACEFYGITPKTEPTAEDFKVVSKDAQIVQEGEIAVTKESLQAAKAETVEIMGGQILLGVSVLSNSDITASTAWAPVKFPEGTQIGLSTDGTKLVLPIPVAAQQGFMILQSGDAKAVPSDGPETSGFYMIKVVQ